jgi:hypothetical protein
VVDGGVGDVMLTGDAAQGHDSDSFRPRSLDCGGGYLFHLVLEPVYFAGEFKLRLEFGPHFRIEVGD